MDEIGSAPKRLLLTAHGLPERVVAAGDPYRLQVEETAAAIVKLLHDRNLRARPAEERQAGDG